MFEHHFAEGNALVLVRRGFPPRIDPAGGYGIGALFAGAFDIGTVLRIGAVLAIEAEE